MPSVHLSEWLSLNLEEQKNSITCPCIHGMLEIWRLRGSLATSTTLQAWCRESTTWCSRDKFSSFVEKLCSGKHLGGQESQVASADHVLGVLPSSLKLYLPHLCSHWCALPFQEHLRLLVIQGTKSSDVSCEKYVCYVPIGFKPSTCDLAHSSSKHSPKSLVFEGNINSPLIHFSKFWNEY